MKKSDIMNYIKKLKKYYTELESESRTGKTMSEDIKSIPWQKISSHYLSLRPYDPALSKEYLYFRTIRCPPRNLLYELEDDDLNHAS